jgi:hypothetical protein
VLDVLRDLLRRCDFAVEAAPRLRRDVAPEEPAALALAELALERGRHLVFPVRDEGGRELPDLVRLHRVLERRRVEVEEEERDRAAVHGGAVGDGTEVLGEGPPQRLLRLVGVAQPRERDVERLVALPLADVDRDLVVARHVDDAVDDLLQVGDVRVEQLGLGELVERGADLPPRMAVGAGLALAQQPVVLLLEDRDAVGALREGAAREPSEQKRRALKLSLRSPLAHHDVLDRLEVVDGTPVVAVVDVHDPLVAG